MRGTAFVGLLLPALFIVVGRFYVKIAEKIATAIIQKLDRGVKEYKKSIDAQALETNTKLVQ